MATRSAIKGITIEIGGDTTGLQSALKQVDSSLRTTQNNLKDINKLLKLDPGNTELLTQKQQELQKAVKGTKERLETLKSVQKDSVTPEQWDAVQREIIETEQNLKQLQDELKEFGTVATQKMKVAGENVKAFGDKISEAGTALSTYVTAPLAGLGAAAYASFVEVDEGMDMIIKKTGATGEALDDMGDIMERIAANIPTDFATAGEAVGEVNTRFGLTGDALEELSTQFIRFAALNDTDVTSSIDGVQKALTAFGLSADDASGYLDYLTLVSQQTGADVNALMGTVVTNSTAFKEMGLSIYDATTLLGQLEVSGADSSVVMGGLKKALKNAAKEGKPLDQALAELQDTIVNGTDSTDGLTAAYDLFGTAGAQVFELVRSGAIDFNSLAGSADKAAGTVTDTFNSTLDPADQFTMAMNALKETGAAIAETVMPMVSDALGKVRDVILKLKAKWDSMDDSQKQTILTIGGIVAAVGPVVLTIGKLVSGVGGVISILGSLFGAVGGILPGGLIVVGLVAAGKLIMDHWDEIKSWVVNKLWPKLRDVWENVRSKVEDVFGKVKGYWETTLKPALEALWKFVVETVWPKLKEAFDSIRAKVASVFAAIKSYWDTVLKPALDALWKFVVEVVVPQAVDAWNNLKNAAAAVFAAIKNFWETTLKPAMDALWKFISETVVPKAVDAWNNLKNTVAAVFANVKNFWETTLKPAMDALWKFISEVVVPKATEAWNGFKNTVAVVFAAVKNFWDNTLKPAFDALWKFVSETVVPLASKAWEGFQSTVDTVFSAIVGFWETTLQPAFEAIRGFVVDTLGPIFDNTFNGIKEIVDNTLGAIKSLWEDSVKPIYEGIVEFFTGVFSGDWESAWDGIQKVGEGVWAYLTTVVETFVDNALTWGRTILENIKTGMEGVWESFVKPAIDAIWSALPEGIQTAVTDALEWGSNLISNIKDGIVTGWDTVKQFVEETFASFAEIPQKLVDAALTWGSQIIDNLKQGIIDKWDAFTGWFDERIGGIGNFFVGEDGIVTKAKSWGEDTINSIGDGINSAASWVEGAASDVATGIANFLHFSEPKEGPLSDFANSGEDMMRLFADSIRNGMWRVSQEVEAIGGKIEIQFRDIGAISAEQFRQGLDGYWGGNLKSTVKGAFDTALSEIYHMDWGGLGRSIYDNVTFYCSWIKGAYRDAFDFSGIHVKTPHWRVTRWNEISGTYFPSMTVDWYKRAYDNPIMFTKPTVMATAGGYKGFGDGAGAEVVLSAAKLRELVGAGGTTNNTINVYTQPGQDARQIAQEVQRIMVREQNQRSAAYA